jgi:hypothetical protein
MDALSCRSSPEGAAGLPRPQQGCPLYALGSHSRVCAGAGPSRQRLVQEVVRIGSQLSALDTAARPVDVANRASAGAAELA